jgi:hypothetical protein
VTVVEKKPSALLLVFVKNSSTVTKQNTNVMFREIPVTGAFRNVMLVFCVVTMQ